VGTVPLFNKVELTLNEKPFTIVKELGRKITDLTVDGRTISDYYLTQDDLTKGNEL
jgi:hypothetical protein